ncbi:MAG: PqqD family protein [Nitrospirota bacterium]
MNVKKPVRKEGILSRQLGEEWILYDTRNGAVHVINAMAEFVWRKCDGTHDLAAIEQSIRDAYSVPDSRDVKKDLEQVIRQFADLGVLTDQ